MFLSLLLPFAFPIYPKIETYTIPFSENFPISLLEGSLVFINTDSYTSDDFIFQFKSKNSSTNFHTDDFELLSSKNATNITFLSPIPNVHLIFDRELCGDFFTVIPNLKKIKEKITKHNHSFFKNKKPDKKFNQNQRSDYNNSIILHFWRIPDGLCDINSYVIRSNNLMSVVPRSRSFSRFCFFSSINFTDKFNYKFNFHTTGRSALKSREMLFKLNETLPKINSFLSNSTQTDFASRLESNNSIPQSNFTTISNVLSVNQIGTNIIDESLNFIVELFVSGNTGSTLVQSDVDIELTRPFLILGSVDDLNIGKLLLKFQSDDSECSAIPIVNYRHGKPNNQKIYSNQKHILISKETDIQFDSNSPSIDKFEPEKEENQNFSEKKSKLTNLIDIMKSKLFFYMCKMKGKNICDPKSNSFSFSYSTLFSPLLSLSTVSIELEGWKRIDVKCIEKGNDADAGFISLVVILVGMVIFVLINARKFVICDLSEMNGIHDTVVENNEIHLDIKDSESENEN